MMESYRAWIDQGFQVLGPAGRVLLIIAVAWILHRLVRALIGRLGTRSIFPAPLVVGLRRTASSLITIAALLLALDQFGVSATVLWTAFTGFVAVAAIAFFAGWSVLSNVFCMLLIVTTRPFRLYDEIEVLENGEKPGLRGQVVDLNLIYTTLRETGPDGTGRSVLQVPNSLFFQRIIRRWGQRPYRSEPAVQEGSSVRDR
jgi:small-conductance mechanosensitive channel